MCRYFENLSAPFSVTLQIKWREFCTLFGAVAASSRTNDQALACRLHDWRRDRSQLVDFQQPRDLREQPLEQPEIPAGNANDCG